MINYDKYRSDHTTFMKSMSVDQLAWLNTIRRRGISSFNSLGFPTATRGNEKWKYTNVAPLANMEFEFLQYGDSSDLSDISINRLLPGYEAWTRMVFIDGKFASELSDVNEVPNDLIVANLGDVVSKESKLVSEYLGQIVRPDNNGFAAINTAYIQDGGFVHVPAGISLDLPLHLVFLTTNRPIATVSYPRSLISIGNNAKLTVVESYISMSEGPYLTDAVTEMVIGEGAEVDHYRYLMEGSKAFHIGTTGIKLESESTLKSTSFARGARIARNDINVLLDAPGSSCDLNGLYFTSGTQHIDNHITVDHAKPYTTSNLLFKGILDDNSRAVFNGGVLVRENAQKTNARQSDKNLILSKGARINTKPSLEIFADDVQCTHGATAGAVAEEALFYMKSRGLNEEMAKTLLVYGFASEIIDEMPPLLMEQTKRYVSDILPEIKVTEAA